MISFHQWGNWGFPMKLWWYGWQNTDVDSYINVINLHVKSHVSDLYTWLRNSPRWMPPQHLPSPLFFSSFSPTSVALTPHRLPVSLRPLRPSGTLRIHAGNSLLETRTSTSGVWGTITCGRETFSLHHGSELGDKGAGCWLTVIW